MKDTLTGLEKGCEAGVGVVVAVADAMRLY